MCISWQTEKLSLKCCSQSCSTALLECAFMDAQSVSAASRVRGHADPAAELIARAIERGHFRRPPAARREAARGRPRRALRRLPPSCPRGAGCASSGAGIIVEGAQQGRLRSPLRGRTKCGRSTRCARSCSARRPCGSSCRRTRMPIARLKRFNEDYESGSRGRGLPAACTRSNDRFHAELFRPLQQPADRLPHQDLHMEMTYAVRGAAFADPENLDKSRAPPPNHDPASGGHRFMGARADLRRPHPNHQGSIPRLQLRGPEASLTRFGVRSDDRNPAKSLRG